MPPLIDSPSTIAVPHASPAHSTFAALAISDELRLDWKLQPSDIPIINNLSMLHAKSALKVSVPESVKGVGLSVFLPHAPYPAYVLPVGSGKSTSFNLQLPSHTPHTLPLLPPPRFSGLL